MKHKKLKVLHVGKFYPPERGGMESHLKDVCDQLQKHLAVEVLVSSTGRRTVDELIDGVPVTRLGTPVKMAGTSFSPEMIGRIKSSQADIIHLHLPNPAAVLAYMMSRHPARLVCTYHSDVVRQKVLGAAFQPVLNRFLKRSSAILAASPNYIESSATLSRIRERCHVVPFGITEHPPVDASAVQALRQRYGGDRLVLAVGRLVYYKGFEYLIRAMQDVRGQLCIVGGGPLQSKLESLIREVGVSDRVTLLGEIDDPTLQAFYHATDVFVLPSIARSEAFGIVQAEAMSAGKPVVNTSLDSGVPFVSIHGLTGLTVPPRSPQALSDAINTLLDNDRLRQELGENGRYRVATEFSQERMIERILAIYEKVARQPHGVPVPATIYSAEADTARSVSVGRQ